MTNKEAKKYQTYKGENIRELTKEILTHQMGAVLQKVLIVLFVHGTSTQRGGGQTVKVKSKFMLIEHSTSQTQFCQVSQTCNIIPTVSGFSPRSNDFQKFAPKLRERY